MRNFPYPLPLHALAEFCHPAPASILSRPVSHGGETLVGNGHLALRIRKGQWMDSEHAAASAAYLERFERLPWDFAPTALEWHCLDDVRGTLFRGAAIGFWFNGEPAPCPVVWVAETIRVRLSLLQLIARLPRAEICARLGELLIRFSGGIGIAPAARALNDRQIAFSIFAPERCPMDGHVMGKHVEVRLTQPGVNWPPVDMTDAEGATIACDD